MRLTTPIAVVCIALAVWSCSDDHPPVTDGLELGYWVDGKGMCRLEFKKSGWHKFAVDWIPRGCAVRPQDADSGKPYVVNGFLQHNERTVRFGEFGFIYLPKKFRKKGNYRGPDGLPLRIDGMEKWRGGNMIVSSTMDGPYTYKNFYDPVTGLLLAREAHSTQEGVKLKLRLKEHKTKESDG